MPPVAAATVGASAGASACETNRGEMLLIDESTGSRVAMSNQAVPTTLVNRQILSSFSIETGLASTLAIDDFALTYLLVSKSNKLLPIVSRAVHSLSTNKTIAVQNGCLCPCLLFCYRPTSVANRFAEQYKELIALWKATTKTMCQEQISGSIRYRSIK